MILVDAHHHIWDPSVGDFSWMTSAHAPINRIFTAEELAPLLADAAISRTVLVQTCSSFEESERFLDVAEATPFIAGVVAWIDLEGDVGAQLDRLLARPSGRWLRGIRHQVHDEPDPAWLLRPGVLAGLRNVFDRGLAYDLLIRPRELAAAYECASALPEGRFVVDHIAKPRIADGWDREWEVGIIRLAELRDRVWIKLSGMVTEADWAHWNQADIQPYADLVMDSFGGDRVMFGSDWPVCTLAADYIRTVRLVRDLIATRSTADQAAILGGNAVEAYALAL